MAQQESFDPKPYSPIEFRGDMGLVKTKTGEQFGETLTRLAGIADRMTVIRSMTHGEAAHERGVHNMFTGYKPSPALVFPSFGSVVSENRQENRRGIDRTGNAESGNRQDRQCGIDREESTGTGIDREKESTGRRNRQGQESTGTATVFIFGNS